MKKYRILLKSIDFRFYFIVMFLIGITIGTLELPRIPIIIVLSLTYFFLYMYVYTLINKEIKKATDELDDKCDPYKFLEIIDDIIIYISNPKELKQSLLLNRTAGHSAAGNIDDAIKLLKEININRLNSTFKALYYNNLASCYIQNLELQNAEDNLNQFLEFIDKDKINKKSIEIFKDIYKINSIYLNMYNGNFDKCIEQLEEIYSKVEKPRLKVSCKFGIGYCYYMNDEKLKAKEYFEYVIDNGNKLYNVKQAQEYIKKI